ncbi:MAG TPA: LPS export ABC transporter periplasmic protein LptC [Nitratidesulfovibrio sp.]|nr:LPS export ABC transporter periplasmic protein LptC [Nitratidesulfovibrio sp.]
MRRRTLVILLAVLLAVGGAAVWRWQAGVRKALETAMAGEAPSSAALEEAVGVAMKGIELVQGEKGIELWRLKATWAQLRQSNNVIDVDSPDLVYQMDGGRQLRIVAKKGEVQQQVQMVRMWDEVHATHEQHELFANLMVYNGTRRTMYFPEGARIAGQTLSGNATRLEWDVVDNVLRGSDGVSMLLTPRPDEKAGQFGRTRLGDKVAQPTATPKASATPSSKADAVKKSTPAHSSAGQPGQKPAGQKASSQKASGHKASGQKTSPAKAAPQGASTPTKQESRQ